MAEIVDAHAARTRSGSTLSLEIAIDGTSERKLFSRICFAASGKNGSSGVASAMLTMFPKFALVTEMGGEGDRRGFRRSS